MSSSNIAPIASLRAAPRPRRAATPAAAPTAS